MYREHGLPPLRFPERPASATVAMDGFRRGPSNRLLAGGLIGLEQPNLAESCRSALEHEQWSSGQSTRLGRSPQGNPVRTYEPLPARVRAG